MTLLLHGLASNARIWEPVAPNLTARGLAPLALDLRRHGQSDRPDAGYDFDTITDDIAASTEELDLERPLIVGHSWGGALALHYAARFASDAVAPSGIVLVDGGIGQLDDIPGVTWEPIRDLLTPPRLAGVRLDALLVKLKRGTASWQPDETAMDIELANFDLHPDGTVSPRLTFERHMRIVRSMWEYKTYDDFAKVRCPVMMIPVRPPRPWDKVDEGYLALKERGLPRAKQAIEGLSVRWFEDSIHDLPLQRPQALAETITEFSRELL
ncbi:MAG: alpha/beta fold hydrolase [Chloroflexota bacterium]